MIECPRCHHENPDGSVVCTMCRTYLGWSPAAATRPREVPAPAAPAAPPEAATDASRPDSPRPPAPAPADDPADHAADHAAPPAASATPGNRFSIGPPAPVAGAPTSRPTTPRPAPSARVRHTPDPVPVVLEPGPAVRAQPREAPERSIGVRVNAGTARIAPRTPGDDGATTAPPGQFGAVRPEDAGQYTGHRPGSAGGPDGDPSGAGSRTDVDPTDAAIRCPVCHRALPASRRFCRCGATLVRPVVLEEEPDEPALPWYRRLAESLRRGRGFWHRMREANDGIQARYDKVRSLRVYAGQATAALAAVGLGGALLLPSATDLRTEALGRLADLDPRGYVKVPATVTAATEPVDPQYDPTFAVDGTTGRAWAGVWVPPADPGTPCDRPGGTAALALELDQPTDVDRIVVVAGLPVTSPDRGLQDRPAQIDVRWGEGADDCTTIDLEDEAEPQAFDLEARQITSVTIVIASTFAPPEPPDTRHVALAEVQLQHRGALTVGTAPAGPPAG